MKQVVQFKCHKVKHVWTEPEMFQRNGPTYSHPKRLVCTCRWCAKFWMQILTLENFKHCYTRLLQTNLSPPTCTLPNHPGNRWFHHPTTWSLLPPPTSQFLTFWDHVTFKNFEVQANSRITRSLSSLRACCKCTSHRRKHDIQGGQDSNLKMGQGTTIYSMLSFVLCFWSMFIGKRIYIMSMHLYCEIHIFPKSTQLCQGKKHSDRGLWP